jgi:hypothetical protein
MFTFLWKLLFGEAQNELVWKDEGVWIMPENTEDRRACFYEIYRNKATGKHRLDCHGYRPRQHFRYGIAVQTLIDFQVASESVEDYPDDPYYW